MKKPGRREIKRIFKEHKTINSIKKNNPEIFKAAKAEGEDFFESCSKHMGINTKKNKYL